MSRRPEFESEAALCASFLAWVTKESPGVRHYAEWGGWDILLVHPKGWQIGIQAKLRLNAEVIGQAAPDDYWFVHEQQGPDFRAVLVPGLNPLAGLASRLGLVVFHAANYTRGAFWPDIIPRWSQRGSDVVPSDWLDWNPASRHDLPATPTDSVAGSSAPVSLTPWKLRALDVLAELALKGTITAKRIKDLGVDPGRWTTYRWLEPGEKRGDWLRAPKCPAFDEQHPSAYALALEKARERGDAA